MKRWHKITFLVVAIPVITYGLMGLMGLRFFTIPTSSMAKTIPKGAIGLVSKIKAKPERFDILVHRFPHGDTIAVSFPHDYYMMKRKFGKKYIASYSEIEYVPLNKRVTYVGRCVGLPGDELEMRDSKLYINGEYYTNPNIMENYRLETKGNKSISKSLLTKLDIDPEIDYFYHKSGSTITLTEWQAQEILKLPIVRSLEMLNNTSEPDNMIFPNHIRFPYYNDNYGPITIPARGITFELNLDNLPLYQRLISVYEKANLKVSGNQIYINGKLADSYTPKMDYFFIISDNRDNSADSRYWGFLPQDHLMSKVWKVVKL